jgi:hypothetical protein
MLRRLRAVVRSYWPSSDDDGDVWDAIPGSQYDGRHAESGGISRGEQEAAIADVQEQAEAIDEDAATAHIQE